MKKVKFCRYGTLNAYRNSRGQGWKTENIGDCYNQAPERVGIYCFPYGYVEPYLIPFGSIKKHTNSSITISKKDFHVFYIDQDAEIYTHLGELPNVRILKNVGFWNLIKAKDLEYFLKKRKKYDYLNGIRYSKDDCEIFIPHRVKIY